MSHPSRSICVFCGARAGDVSTFTEAGTELGTAIANRGWRLIYGAGDRGIMGAVAEGASTAGGQQLGVIPTHLIGNELTGEMQSRVVITETMHERKKVMFMNADAVVVLPGGAGTLDEFFEVLTWRQIGLHEKPIFIVNVDGYWDPLLELLESVIARGFADASLRGFMTVAADVPEVVAAIEAALD